MSNTFTASERSILRRQTAPLAYLWRFQYLNGTERRLTLHDQTLSRYGLINNDPAPGLEGFAIRKESGLKAMTSELRGSFDETGATNGIPINDFRARRIANAVVECRMVNWMFPFASRGVQRLRFKVRDYDYDEHEWRVQLGSPLDRLEMKRGEAYTQTCLNQLSVTNGVTSYCHYPVSTLFSYPNMTAGCGIAVSPAPTRRKFEAFRFITNPINSASIHVEDYFSHGKIIWTNGLNAGLVEKIEKQEVGQDQNHVLITLQRPMPFDVTASNDVCTLIVGCNKTEDECRDKFNQFTTSYRGAPHIPGNISSLRTPPGS